MLNCCLVISLPLEKEYQSPTLSTSTQQEPRVLHVPLSIDLAKLFR